MICSVVAVGCWKDQEQMGMQITAMCLVAQLCLTLCDPMDCSPPGSSVQGDPPGKNTAVGCHAFLQRIFPAQGSNSGLLHFRQILYHLSHQEIPNNNNQIRSDQISRSIVSDSLQPHESQHTRSPCPSPSPGVH